MGEMSFERDLIMTIDESAKSICANLERIADLLEEQNDIAARAYGKPAKDIVGDQARDYLYGERGRGR